MKRLVLLFMFVLSIACFAYGEEWIYVCNGDRETPDYTFWFAKNFEKTESGTFRVRTKMHQPTKRYYTGNGTYYTAEERDFISMYEVSSDLKRAKYIGKIELDKTGKVVNQSNGGNNYFEKIYTQYNEPRSKVWRALLNYIADHWK